MAGPITKMNQRFGKAYKLCSQKTIAAVFKEGCSVRSYPFVVHYRKETLPEGQPFQVVFSAPKRTFKRAHDRNYIKRLLREAFRMKKLILEERLTTRNEQLALFVIYTAKEAVPLQQLLVKTEQLLLKIAEELEHETPQK